jgi:hypothetical protein
VIVTFVMALSTSGPANNPSRSASAMIGLSLGASSAVIEGQLTAFEKRAANQIIRHLLGDLHRDIFLRLTGRGTEVCVQTTLEWLNSGFSVARSFTNTSKAAPAT